MNKLLKSGSKQKELIGVKNNNKEKRKKEIA